MADQLWWNSTGGKAMVEHRWLNTSRETVMVEKQWWISNGGKVMVER